ncbi:hypothetical protein DSBG_2067 [Desulfosporosinus sp. BG]|nr:hypothetical protein DSBG_2067 [Desulfosporosinus sp. BG]
MDPTPLMKGQVGLSLVGCSPRGLTCCKATLWAGITDLDEDNHARFFEKYVDFDLQKRTT